ncbi:hypothetical protein ACC745_18585 [Rhizobium ruizarguesonis]
MTRAISGHPASWGTMQGEDMLQAYEVGAMLRLHELGWGAKRRNLDVLATLSADIFVRVER